MLNWSLRYAPAVRLLQEAAVRSVLDVGSGRHGVSRFLRGPQIVQTDLDEVTRVPGCTVVRADATHLPFADAAFDAVLSLDLVEHIAPERRAAALDEMFRVARELVVVAFPVAPGAPEADEELFRQLTERGRPVPPWLAEHRHNGYPTVELGRVHPPGWLLQAQALSDPLWLHTRVARLEHHRVLGRVSATRVPLSAAVVMSRAKGKDYYRSISVFRRHHVAARA